MSVATNTPRQRSRGSERRRQEILDVAARVFQQRGYDATSLQDIAEAVGILKGSLYYYIDSKEDLLYEILQDVHVQALKNVELIEGLEGNGLERIRVFVNLHVKWNSDNLVKLGVFFQDFRCLGAERQLTIIEERDRYDRSLRQLISEGHQQQVICPEIDARLAALGIFGMTNWIYHWYKPDGAVSPAMLAESYADFVVNGLACTPEIHTPGHRSRIAAAPPDRPRHSPSQD